MFATYLLPFFRSTLKIIFHLRNGSTQRDIFTGHFHREICKGLLYTIALEREREVEKVCQYSQFWLNGLAWRQDGRMPISSQHRHVFENSNLAKCFKKNPTKHKTTTLLYLPHTLLLWGEKAIIFKLLTIVKHYLESCYVLFIWASKRHLLSYFWRIYFIILC